MGYEIEKILKNRIVMLAFCAIVLCNSVLFYRQCTDDRQGFTLIQVQEKYQSWETVEEDAASLEEAIESAVLRGDFAFLDQYSQEDRVYQAALERISQVQQYHENRTGRIEQARIMARLVGQSDPFSARSLQRGIEAYTALEKIQPEVCFTGGFEQLTSWQMSDLFVLLFGAGTAMILLTMEEQAGYFSLLKPTRRGKTGLYCRKYGAVLISVTAGFLLLRGTELMTVVRIFGMEHLDAPVQSMLGYERAIQAISIGQYLLLFYLLKYLWAVACASIFFAICAWATSSGAVAGGTVVLLAISLLFGGSGQPWLQALSLSKIVRFEEAFQEPLYLNLFGIPLDRLAFAGGYLLALAAVSFALGRFAFCQTRQGNIVKRPQVSLVSNLGSHTSLWLHEGYKFWVIGGGIVILLCFVLIQTGCYWNFKADNSIYESYYQHYSSILEGQPNEEKAAYLKTESQRFQEINMELERLQEPYSSAAALAEIEDLTRQLRPQEAFESAKEQYEALREGQSYLYRTPYEYLFGGQGKREDLQNLAKCVFALILAISGMNAVERETGVSVLQTTAEMEKAVLGRKLSHLAIFVLLAGMAAFLPMRICICSHYGMLDFGAQANSLPQLAALPDGWIIAMLFAVQLAGLMVWSLLAGLACFWLSKKTGNTTITILVSLIGLVVPVVLMIMALGETL